MRTIPLLLLAIASCTTQTVPNPAGNNVTERPIATEPTKEPVDDSTECFAFNPRETSDNEKLSFLNQWILEARAFLDNGSVSDIILAQAQTNMGGIAQLCLPKAARTGAILVTATNDARDFEFVRLLLPASVEAVPPAQEAPPAGPPPLIIDQLTTHLTRILRDIHELPASGPLGTKLQPAFDALDEALRLDRHVKDGLEEGELTEEETRTAWNDNVASLSPAAVNKACLFGDFPDGSAGFGTEFTFEGGAPESFSKGFGTLLAPDGSLAYLFGTELDDMTITVNGVDLNALPWDSIRHSGGDLSGAILEAREFDASDNLTAKLKLVNVNNGWDEDVIIPCVVGVLSVKNNSGDDEDIAAGSSVCVDGVLAGDLFQIPSNGELGDDPDANTDFIVFGDDDADAAWVLGAAGLRDGDLESNTKFRVEGENVCIDVDRDQNIGPHGQGTLYWHLCVVPADTGSGALALVNGASRITHDVGTQPVLFGDDLDEREVAGYLGRSDFMQNPRVITFLDDDERDSLINFYGGKTTNVILVGNGLNANYEVYLNGEGDELATISTGPDGQWSGSIAPEGLKVGDLLRFSEKDSDLEDGAYFDVPVVEKCAPDFPF